MLSLSKHTLALVSLLCAGILFASFSPADANFGTWRSSFVSAVTGRSPPSTASADTNHQIFERDPEHPAKNCLPLHNQLHADSEEKTSSVPRSVTESTNEETVSQESSNLREPSHKTDASSFSSQEIHAALKSALETVQGIQAILDPSNLVDDAGTDAASAPASTSKALKQIRQIIYTLSTTHDALLDRKLAELPFFQRLWYRMFFSYRYSPLGRKEHAQKHQLRTTLHDPANDDASGEGFRTVIAKIKSNMAHWLSSLKELLRNAVHDEWLITPDVNAYISEVANKVNALRDKYRYKVELLMDAAKSIGTSLSSNERVHQIVSSMEEIVKQFQDEIWRMRTEWIYRRSEALSWASNIVHEIKQMQKHEFARLSEAVCDCSNSMKHAFMERLERLSAHMAYLRHHAAARTNDCIRLMWLWKDIRKGFFRAAGTILKHHVMKFPRIIAFIMVIAFFRFLLYFKGTKPSVFSLISRAFGSPRTTAPAFSSRDSSSASKQVLATASVESTAESKSSESKRMRKGQTREGLPHDLSRPVRIQETISARKSTANKATTKLQRRRAPPPPGSIRSVRMARPLHISNSDYQSARSDVQQHREGKPLSIGDHEVQLVYDESPTRTFPTKANNVVRRVVKEPGQAAVQGVSRPEHGKRVPVIEIDDDDDVSEATSNRLVGDSRQTRSSVRRTSTQRKQLR